MRLSELVAVLLVVVIAILDETFARVRRVLTKRGNDE